MFLTDAASNVLYGYQTDRLMQPDGSQWRYDEPGQRQLLPNTSDPVYTMIDSTGKYLYVANNSTTSTLTTTPFSSIVGFDHQHEQPGAAAHHRGAVSRLDPDRCASSKTRATSTSIRPTTTMGQSRATQLNADVRRALGSDEGFYVHGDGQGELPRDQRLDRVAAAGDFPAGPWRPSRQSSLSGLRTGIQRRAERCPM